MSVPSNVVQFQGLGVQTADNMNTAVQVIANYNAMRAFPAQNNMVVLALGTSTPADGGQGMYYFNSTSTAVDNNSTVIVPFGSTQGAWLILPIPGAAGFPTLPTTLPSKPGIWWNNGGAVSIS